MVDNGFAAAAAAAGQLDVSAAVPASINLCGPARLIGRVASTRGRRNAHVTRSAVNTALRVHTRIV